MKLVGKILSEHDLVLNYTVGLSHVSRIHPKFWLPSSIFWKHNTQWWMSIQWLPSWYSVVMNWYLNTAHLTDLSRVNSVILTQINVPQCCLSAECYERSRLLVFHITEIYWCQKINTFSFYRDRVYSWIVCFFLKFLPLCWCNTRVPLSREINRPNSHTNSTLQTLLCLPDIVKAK